MVRRIGRLFVSLAAFIPAAFDANAADRVIVEPQEGPAARAPAPPPSDPWLVDVSDPGTVCVRPGLPVVLWRRAPLSQIVVIFSPRDLSWQVSGTWPASAERLELPATMPLRDNTDYVVDLAGKLAPVTIRLIPETAENDPMLIGSMNALGCGVQASALARARKD